MTLDLARARALAAAFAVVLVAGCATPGGGPPPRYDPFEPFNRAMYAIHEPIDDHVLKPVAQAWLDYLPRPFTLAVANFFGNIEDGFSALNGLLQGKWEKAGHDMGRVILNSSFGIAGLIDIASDAGIPRGEEDFGQTFGYWGFPQGPFLFVPLIGPTTVRDGTGLVVRAYASPLIYAVNDVPLRNVLYGLGYVSLRAQLLEASSVVETAALDRYSFIRRSYLQRREYLVHDGNPPPRKDDDE